MTKLNCVFCGGDGIAFWRFCRFIRYFKIIAVISVEITAQTIPMANPWTNHVGAKKRANERISGPMAAATKPNVGILSLIRLAAKPIPKCASNGI